MSLGLSAGSRSARLLGSASAAATSLPDSNVSGNEDTSINLNVPALTLADPDSEEFKVLQFEGLPEGVVISDGTRSITVDSSGVADIKTAGNDWDFTNITVFATTEQ